MTFPRVELAEATRALVALLMLALVQTLGALGTLHYPAALIWAHFVSLALAQWPALYMARLGAAWFPVPAGRWLRWALGHAVCFLLFVGLMVPSMLGLRALAEIMLQLRWPASTALQELLRSVPAASVVYLLGVAASLTAHTQMQLQRTNLAALALQRELSEAQHAQLRARLDPTRALGALARARGHLANDWQAAETELLQLSEELRERRAVTQLDVPDTEAALAPGAWAAPALHEPFLPSLSFKTALGSLAAFLALAALQGAALVASGDSRATYLLLVTGAVAGWSVLPIPYAVVRVSQRLRATRRWLAMAGVQVVGYLTFSLLGVLIARVLQAAGGALLGRPLRGPTTPLHDWLLGLQGAVVVYTFLVALFLLFENRRLARLQATRQQALSTQLAEARLAALDARVDPHFLFNALNTVVAILPNDPARSAQLLDSLQTLLEAALESRAPTWELSQELQHTEHFLQLVRTRFGDRIHVTCRVDEPRQATQVPRFSVQTLVENTIKHNARRTQPLHVEVYAYWQARCCSLVVRDDGAGFSQGIAHRPEGALGRLAEILRLLYGERAALRWTHRPGGGAEVTLDLPREGSC